MRVGRRCLGGRSLQVVLGYVPLLPNDPSGAFARSFAQRFGAARLADGPSSMEFHWGGSIKWVGKNNTWEGTKRWYDNVGRGRSPCLRFRVLTGQKFGVALFEKMMASVARTVYLNRPNVSTQRGKDGRVFSVGIWSKIYWMMFLDVFILQRKNQHPANACRNHCKQVLLPCAPFTQPWPRRWWSEKWWNDKCSEGHDLSRNEPAFRYCSVPGFEMKSLSTKCWHGVGWVMVIEW